MSKADYAFSQCTDAEIGRMTECMQKLVVIFEKEGHEFKKSHHRSTTLKKDKKSND
jgi:hypothetical protein